ncbi:MAG: 2-oxo acid dehydrogenase subunit E2 [Rhodospirillaceae bacterium]|nr:2-oxo acid dehydrogenase subunit E2 [Rhodospirillaceae bacterium]
MGKFIFKLPDVGEGTAEAEIVTWHVKPGDVVKEDQPILDVMTDKATVELTSPVVGTVTETQGQAGDKAAVGSIIITFEVEGPGNVSDEKAAAKPAAAPKAEPVKVEAPKVEAPKPAPKPEPVAAKAAAPEKTVQPRVAGERPLASPAVRKRADEMGIKLQFVPGTGPGGRIGHEDLDAFIASGGNASAGGGGSGLAKRSGVEEIKIIGLRRKIAERMQEAKRHIPHITYVEEVDVTELDDLRAHLNATKKPDQPKLTLLPFIMRAICAAMTDHPQINSTFDDDANVVYRHKPVHIGIATQTPNGLMVSVVRHAEARDVWDSAAELKRVADAARTGKATTEELSGSTITITSLGTLGGITHTPIINRPEVAIVGPNKIVERPMVRNGQVAIRKMMNISSSFDHRIIDGFDAASFIQTIKTMLEHPATIFMR